MITLKPGDKAPEFTAQDHQGNSLSLRDFLGKKVILYFYPKDATPGCTAQACNLRDHHDQLLHHGYVVLGVSQDSQASHQRFIDKQNLPFALIADTDHAVHQLYGTWDMKSNYGRQYMGTLRTTFVIDTQGRIEKVIEKVKTKDHTAQILG